MSLASLFFFCYHIIFNHFLRNFAYLLEIPSVIFGYNFGTIVLPNVQNGWAMQHFWRYPHTLVISRVTQLGYYITSTLRKSHFPQPFGLGRGKGKQRSALCDAIQQKVHKVGKLVFPNAVEIGRDLRNIKKKIKLIDASEVELWCVTFVIVKFSPNRIKKKWCRVIIYVQEHTIHEQVLNWFSWNSHAWCGSTHWWNLLYWETMGPVEPPICGKNYFSQLFWNVFVCFFWKNRSMKNI